MEIRQEDSMKSEGHIVDVLENTVVEEDEEVDTLQDDQSANSNEWTEIISKYSEVLEQLNLIKDEDGTQFPSYFVIPSNNPNPLQTSGSSTSQSMAHYSDSLPLSMNPKPSLTTSMIGCEHERFFSLLPLQNPYQSDLLLNKTIREKLEKDRLQEKSLFTSLSSLLPPKDPSSRYYVRKTDVLGWL